MTTPPPVAFEAVRDFTRFDESAGADVGHPVAVLGALGKDVEGRFQSSTSTRILSSSGSFAPEMTMPARTPLLR